MRYMRSVRWFAGPFAAAAIVSTGAYCALSLVRIEPANNHHRSDGLVPKILVIDVAGDGIRLRGSAGGPSVHFGDGIRRASGWIYPNSDDAFVMVDVNQNGRVDSLVELLGAQGPPSGFRYLAAFDGVSSSDLRKAASERTSHPDGVIDSTDGIFRRLVLWSDVNGDATSDESELESLVHAGVIALDIKVTSRHKNLGNGNWAIEMGFATVRRSDRVHRVRLAGVQLASADGKRNPTVRIRTVEQKTGGL